MFAVQGRASKLLCSSRASMETPPSANHCALFPHTRPSARARRTGATTRGSARSGSRKTTPASASTRARCTSTTATTATTTACPCLLVPSCQSRPRAIPHIRSHRPHFNFDAGTSAPRPPSSLLILPALHQCPEQRRARPRAAAREGPREPADDRAACKRRVDAGFATGVHPARARVWLPDSGPFRSPSPPMNACLCATVHPASWEQVRRVDLRCRRPGCWTAECAARRPARLNPPRVPRMRVIPLP